MKTTNVTFKIENDSIQNFNLLLVNSFIEELIIRITEGCQLMDEKTRRIIAWRMQRKRHSWEKVGKLSVIAHKVALSWDYLYYPTFSHWICSSISGFVASAQINNVDLFIHLNQHLIKFDASFICMRGIRILTNQWTLLSSGWLNHHHPGRTKIMEWDFKMTQSMAQYMFYNCFHYVIS